MFRNESVNSTRKFTIVAEIVSLLKKIYKRDAPFRAVFKVKTLAVLFSAYPRDMKHIPRTGFVRVLENLESPGILFWHFPGLESPGKRPLVLESPGNLLNSTKNMKFMVGSKGN